EVAEEIRSAEHDGTPGFVGGEQHFEKERGGDRAEELGEPVAEDVESVQAFRQPIGDGDGGVKVSSRDVNQCKKECGEGETRGESYGPDAGGALQKTLRAGGAGPEENESESAEEFRSELLHGVEHQASGKDGKSVAKKGREIGSVPSVCSVSRNG